MLGGFLGLTVVGAAFQFYPPAVGVWPYANDRTALVSIGLLGGGLGIQILGLVGRVDWVITIGTTAGVLGAVVYTYLLLAAFARQRT
jgi:ABC-type enterochelin transport system permease subunit